MRFRRSPVDPGLALFLATAAWGWLVAFDRQSATVKLTFVCAGVALHYALRFVPSHVRWRDSDVPLLRILVVAFPALLALYFVFTNDWSRPVEKVAWLDPIRRALATIQVTTAAPSLHPNVAGGALAALIPLQAAALVPRSVLQRGVSVRPLAVGWSATPLALSLAGLALTGLRGAWLALALASSAWVWWRLCATVLGARRARGTWLAGLAVMTLLIALVAWYGVGASLRPDRILVWGHSWGLAHDYALTGLGLGCFTMPYSSYALLVHVPHTTHAHNLLLDIWLEQGALGLLSFVGIVVAAVVSQRRTGAGPATGAPGLRTNRTHERTRPRSGVGVRNENGSARRWRAAALVALGVVLVHGMIDDTYYGYGGIGAVLLFVPVAFLASVGHARRESAGVTTTRDALRARAGDARVGRSLVAAVVVVVAMTLVLAAWPRSRAVARASWGALLQTRAEMSVYRWPEWPVQDAVRRSGVVNLSPAEAHYRAALALDPSNAVANRRLGQMELSTGRYEAARAHLLSAYSASPGHRATRQMLGESLAISGDPAAAASLWRTLVLDVDQLAIRRFWYESIGEKAHAELIAQAMALTAN